MRNYIKEILLKLADNKIKFIVAGGVAAVLHGVERMTLDLDIAVDMKKQNLKKFLDVIENMNLTPRAPVSADVLFDQQKINSMIKEKHALVFTFIDNKNPLCQIDVFIDKALSYDSLIKDSDSIDLDGKKIRILSKTRLIELKKSIKPDRSKDIMDIEALQILLNTEKHK